MNKKRHLNKFENSPNSDTMQNMVKIQERRSQYITDNRYIPYLSLVTALFPDLLLWCFHTWPKYTAYGTYGYIC